MFDRHAGREKKTRAVADASETCVSPLLAKRGLLNKDPYQHNYLTHPKHLTNTTGAKAKVSSANPVLFKHSPAANSAPSECRRAT